jgi:hypothetical protein
MVGGRRMRKIIYAKGTKKIWLRMRVADRSIVFLVGMWVMTRSGYGEVEVDRCS